MIIVMMMMMIMMVVVMIIIKNYSPKWPDEHSARYLPSREAAT